MTDTHLSHTPEQGPQPEDTTYQVPPESAELELIGRRELAVRTVAAISEVLDRDVTLLSLERMIKEPASKSDHLVGVRAVRCMEALARQESPVAAQVGEVGIYHYTEAVILYGADEKKILELMGNDGLSAEQVTGLYALRALIAEYTDGKSLGFPGIKKALATIDLSVADAATDPYNAVELLDQAGFFVNHAGWRTFDYPILAPQLAQRSARLVEDDPDGSYSLAILSAQQAELAQPIEELEHPSEVDYAWRTMEVLHRLLNE